MTGSMFLSIMLSHCWCKDHYLGWVENVQLLLCLRPLKHIFIPRKGARHFLKMVRVVIKLFSVSDET